MRLQVICALRILKKFELFIYAKPTLQWLWCPNNVFRELKLKVNNETNNIVVMSNRESECRYK